MDSYSGDEVSTDNTGSDSDSDESLSDSQNGSILRPHPCVSDLHMGRCYQAQELNDGYPLEEVTIPANTPIIICQICKRVPRELIVLADCNHTFCDMCFDSKLDHPTSPNAIYAKCPQCSKKFVYPMYELHQRGSNTIRPIWLKYRVNCPEMCGYCANPDEVDSHQISTCERRPVLCHNDGCYVICLAKNLLAHNRHCPFRPKLCSKCQLYLPGSNFPHHECLEQLKKAIAG